MTTVKEKICIYWARRDFRLTDNAALYEAVAYAKEHKTQLLPTFVLEDYQRDGGTQFQFGYPQRQFLSRALPAFAEQFESFYIATGKGADTFIELAQQYELHIFVNEDVYTDFYKQIKKLEEVNISFTVTKDQLSISKETRTGAGAVYSVFTPFKNAVWQSFVRMEITPTVSFKDVEFLPKEKVAELPHAHHPSEAVLQKLCSTERLFRVGTHTIDIDTLFPFKTNCTLWYTTETEALSQFEIFLKNGILNYKDKRDSVSEEGTSKMSLALAWGLVSARTLTYKIQTHFKEDLENPFSNRINQGVLTFISELIWREFYKYLFFHKPELMDTEFQERFRNTIAWVPDDEAQKRFKAWVQGNTGYKLVDAAMLQLAHTGWMHNRARMVVASVLTKNLGVNWRWGQEYFRAMLIDLDEASNNEIGRAHV